jgi:predicted alpha/beta hydrolase family esterase
VERGRPGGLVYGRCRRGCQLSLLFSFLWFILSENRKEIKMKTAVILHGVCDKEEYFEMDFPSPSNAHWLPWLQQKFLRNGLLCQCLEMPAPYKPVYEEWKKTFGQLDPSDLSVVVGHSAGCGFFLKWLHENPKVALDKLVLVAPWLDPQKREASFLEFTLDKDALNNVKEAHLFFSEDDMETIKISTERIMREYPNIKRHHYADKGHFCFGDIGETFEDLWEVLK